MNKDSYEQHLKKEGYSQSTIAYHRQVLKKYKKWTEKEQIETLEATYTEILTYIQHCQQRGTGKTGISRYLTVIKNYYHHQEQAGQIKGNPTETIKLQGINRRKLYDIQSPSELTKLYQQYARQPAKDQWKHSRNVAIAGLILYQGLTATDLKQLRPEDIGMREGQINIPAGKKSNGRVLRLESVQIMDQYQYQSIGREQLHSRTITPSEKMFFSTTGTATLYNVLDQILKGLQKIEPRIESLQHIRASVITKWLKKYNLRKAQYMAGHKYISSTEKYQINDLEGLQEEINQYHPLG